MQQCLSKSLKFKGFAALCYSQGFDNPVGSQDEGDPRQQRGNLPSPPPQKNWKKSCGPFEIQNPHPETQQETKTPPSCGRNKKTTKILAGKIPEIQQTVKVGRGICLLKVGLVQRTAPLGLSPAQSWDYKGPFVPPAASLDREWLQESSQLNSWLEFYGKLQGCLVKGAGVASFHFTFVNLLVNYDYFVLSLFFPSFLEFLGSKGAACNSQWEVFAQSPFLLKKTRIWNPKFQILVGELWQSFGFLLPKNSPVPCFCCAGSCWCLIQWKMWNFSILQQPRNYLIHLINELIHPINFFSCSQVPSETRQLLHIPDSRPALGFHPGE